MKDTNIKKIKELTNLDNIAKNNDYELIKDEILYNICFKIAIDPYMCEECQKTKCDSCSKKTSEKCLFCRKRIKTIKNMMAKINFRNCCSLVNIVNKELNLLI